MAVRHSDYATPFYIYVLIDRNTGDWRYIGQSKCPRSRLSQHWTARRYLWRPLYDWLSELDSPPIMEIVDTCIGATADQTEREWIDTAVSDGMPILNTRHRCQDWRKSSDPMPLAVQS